VTVAGNPVPASIIPYCSVHGIGFQSDFILPAKNLAAFFKYYDEYSAKARPQGRTIVFGFSWSGFRNRCLQNRKGQDGVPPKPTKKQQKMLLEKS
jgi:hypothetical protein